MTLIRPVLLLALILSATLSAQDSRPAAPAKESWPPERTIETCRTLVDSGFVPQMVMAWSGADGSGALGFGKLANGDHVDEKSVFEIGSITKVFTSLLLAEIAQDGTIGLDSTIGDLLGKDIALSRDTAAITLEELASHRSGLPRLPGNLIISDESRPYESYDARLITEELMTGKPASPRGEYAYSNYGAGLLGFLLAHQADKSFEALVSERILKPLGMKSTAAEPAADWAARTVPGHNGQVPVPHWKMNALAGAGDLCSSAEDMQIFLKAALAASPDSALGGAFLMMEKARGDAGGGMKIGLGWHLFDHDDIQLVWHNGGTGGFSSFAGFDRKSGRTLVILSASDAPNITNLGVNAFAGEIPSGLDMMETPAKRDWKELPPYEGRYRLPASLMIEVRLKGDYLGAQVAGQSWFTLYPTADKDQFFLAIAGARVHFLRDDKKEIVGLEWTMGGGTTQATRMDELPAFVKLSPEKLKRFEGRYELGVGVEIDVKAEAGRLSVKLAEQPRLDVFPINETDFVYRVVDAIITFVVDDKGEVTALRLHQNGGTQEAERLH